MLEKRKSETDDLQNRYDQELGQLRQQLTQCKQGHEKCQATIEALQDEVAKLKKELHQTKSQRDFYAERNEEMLRAGKPEKVRHIAAGGFL